MGLQFVQKCSRMAACVLALAVAQFALAETEPPVRAEQTLHSILEHDYPRLILVMSFDQLRADNLTRFSDLFLPAMGTGGAVGGFRWLMEHGAVYADAHYNHLPLETGPGHATIMTGAAPSGSGIVGNEWVTTEGRVISCVEDASLHTVGGPRRPLQRGGSGPMNLLAPTVCDELQLSNNRQSKVVGISIKDRAAILMTGHNADAAIWYDAGIGSWVTSSYYTTGTLPKFAARANQERLADKWLGKSWDYLLPKENYVRSQPEGFKGMADARGMPTTFPKKLSESSTQPDANYYQRLPYTPFGIEMIVETAKMAIEDEELGSNAVPDILCISFSPTDAIGHMYGPNSPEAEDVMLRSDRYISDLLNFIRVTISGGLDNVVIVVTGDHGVSPMVEYAQQVKLDAGRFELNWYVKGAQEALATRFPDKDTSNIVQLAEPYLFFRQNLLHERGIDVVEARKAVAEKMRLLPGVLAAWPREEVEHHRLPPSNMADCIYNSFQPERSGDVVFVNKPYWYPTLSYTGSTHGTTFNYDTHVPLIFAGANIKPGLYTARADVRDIAPTLSVLLGICAPACSQGVVLGEMFK